MSHPAGSRDGAGHAGSTPPGPAAPVRKGAPSVYDGAMDARTADDGGGAG